MCCRDAGGGPPAAGHRLTIATASCPLRVRFLVSKVRVFLLFFKRINPFGVVYHKDLYSKPTAGTSRSINRLGFLCLFPIPLIL